MKAPIVQRGMPTSAQRNAKAMLADAATGLADLDLLTTLYAIIEERPDLPHEVITAFSNQLGRLADERERKERNA